MIKTSTVEVVASERLQWDNVLLDVDILDKKTAAFGEALSSRRKMVLGLERNTDQFDLEIPERKKVFQKPSEYCTSLEFKW